ncbi:MAG: ComEC/Rec2 family competence protein [Actinomycetota bacterium]|nr:ComEC/Rec2 family competence protein [Actinomycetota bacterium]
MTSLPLPSRLPAPHLVVGALVLGLAASLVLRVPVGLVALAAAALALSAPFLGATRIVAVAAALAAGGLWWGGVRLEALDASVLAGEVGRTELARLEMTGPARRGAFSVRVPARVLRFGGRDVNEPVLLELPPARSPPQGAIVDLVATVKRPRKAKAGERFDETTYLRRQGVDVVLHAGWYREAARRGGVAGLADRLRGWLVKSIAPGLAGERRALVAGVVLGEDEGLSDELRDAFRASGLYHLLAVSGQNVAYVVFGAILVVWALGLPRWAGQVAALGATAGYVAAVGWQPSVVRAGIAGGLASLAWLASRPTDRWYFLLLGAAVLLAVSPYNALEPGFQLSFAAVAAIFVLVPRLERRLEGYPLPRRLADVLAVSLACGVATAPILWLQFGAVPLWSIVANALAEPAVAPLLGLAFASAALTPALPGAAHALASLNGWLAAYLAWCARLVGGLPHAQLTSSGALAAVAALALLAALGVRARPPRAPRIAVLTAIGLVAVVAWRAWIPDRELAAPPPDGLRVSFLDVGQGDAILVQVREGAVLVDQGPPEGEVAGQLERLGVRRLRALVLTHPQRDHVGAAAEVLADVRVDMVLDPRLPNESPDERAALVEAKRRGVRIVTARAGQAYRLGRLRLRVLWPDGPGSPGEDPNQRAIVLLASYGETDVLLTADAESDVTLPLHPPPVEILKVAHHGSADPGLPDLLALVRPHVAVISVGEGNDYGHPAPSTLRALRAAGDLSVYRTDEDGRVVVDSDGERLSVREER